MFNYCNKIISLDLRDFKISHDAYININIDNIFNNCNNNLTVCYEETIDERLKNILGRYRNNCLCFENSYKLFYHRLLFKR